jgi:hypothetical protein
MHDKMRKIGVWQAHARESTFAYMITDMVHIEVCIAVAAVTYWGVLNTGPEMDVDLRFRFATAIIEHDILPTVIKDGAAVISRVVKKPQCD